MEISEMQCASLLSMWLTKNSSPEVCKEIASDIGYNDSPLFGAKKKKMRLMGELVMMNTALVIFAVNQRFEHDEAKAIIDPFLSSSRKSIFEVLEKHDGGFKERYPNRMAEYFELLGQDKAVLGLTFSFMQHLDVDPLKNLKGQLALAARFGTALKGTLDVLNRMTFPESNPVSDFEREIANWPVKQAKIALQVVSDILKGNVVNLEERISELTVDQFRKVEKLLRRIDGSAEESVHDESSDTEDDAEELDDLDSRAERYHDQIDEQIESSYNFLLGMFGADNTENSARRYSLKTLSVFAVHIATLVAIKREYPKLHRMTLNGFTRTLSFQTPNTMPNVKPPEGMFVSYCSDEESFMHSQTETFEQQGVEPLVRRLLQQLGGRDDDYKLLFDHLEHAARQASRTYLPFLAEE